MILSTLRPRLTVASHQLCRSLSGEGNTFINTQTCRMENGQKAPRIFTDGEYNSRLAKLRSTLQEKGLESAVLTSMHNTAYFSNFVYCAFGRPYAVVVTPESCVTITPLVDGGQPWRRSFQDNLVYTDWKKGNFYRAVNQALGPHNRKVGIEGDHMTLQSHREMQEAAARKSELVDISGAVTFQRMIKSKEEIKLTKTSAKIADIGGAAIRSAIKEGMKEFQVTRAGVAAMVDEIEKEYGEKSEIMDTWAWLQSGINTDGAHNPLTNRTLRGGDILSMNCFPMIQGYYTALERTLFLGSVDDASLKIWEANIKVLRRGLEILQAGKKCSEIAKELNELIDSMGLLKYRSFGYGHSFGVVCHYYGREAGLELREDVDTVIQPGMVVSMEPMFTIPDGQPGAGGYREHDIVVINHDGTAENITGFPVGPEHNIVQ